MLYVVASMRKTLFLYFVVLLFPLFVRFCWPDCVSSLSQHDRKQAGHALELRWTFIVGDSRDVQTGRPARSGPGPVKPGPFWARPARHD
jgi:hypothetical protein